MTDVDVRTAGEGDVEIVAAFAIELHEAMVAGVPDWLRSPQYDRTQLHRMILEIVRDPRKAVFIAELEGEPVGFSEIHVTDQESDPVKVPKRFGYLQNLFVVPSDRGHGHGAALLQASEAWAKEHGAVEMQIPHWEFPGGPGPFYERFGYRGLHRLRVREL
jgi:GNAT superfamily N-acetyltransferase